jgi:chromate reductase, NAD(P)H dehydrogenase (quinone)
MSDVIHILGIAGSLRRNSYNRAALRAAQQLAPDDATIDVFELDGIPVFSQDEEKQPPAKVVEFKKQIRAADAILLVTPEYNYSIPGVLKNAIDWASRPYGDSAWTDKPVAIMGASSGRLGTGRAQYHLRQVFVFLKMHRLTNRKS